MASERLSVESKGRFCLSGICVTLTFIALDDDVAVFTTNRQKYTASVVPGRCKACVDRRQGGNSDWEGLNAEEHSQRSCSINLRLYFWHDNCLAFGASFDISDARSSKS